MNIRSIIAGSVLIVIALSASSAFPSSISAIYHVQGASSESDIASARGAAQRLEQILLKSRAKGRNVKIYVSGIFLLDRPIKITRENSGLLLSSENSMQAIFVPRVPTFAVIEVQQTNGVTIKNITIRKASRNGIYAKDSTDITLKGLLIEGTESKGWSQGAIHLTGNASGAILEKNRIIEADYAAIIVDTDANSDVSRVRIVSNFITNACRFVDDCGAIYINDRGRKSRGVVISNNIVQGFGGTRVDARAIYLDDWASGVIVEGNNIAGPGRYAFHIHGGKDNILRRNRVALDQISDIIRYGRATDGTMADMTGNMLADNILRSIVEMSILSPRPYIGGVLAK